MTTKVVKGSIWTLAGQVAPLAVSLVTTPFVIRMLGAEGYGVLILIILIPSYLGFADFGMSMASTKFASEAYAQGDLEKEARIVRTAALIAFLTSLPFGIALFALSGWLVTLLNVPTHFLSEASLALKIASATFVINFLNAIFNTPQLARLRMDLNTFVTSGVRILGLAATPIVIYLGGGIVGAVSVLLIASLITLSGHLYVSGRLLPSLRGLTFERDLIRPLLTFGSGLVASGIAAVVLANIERPILAKVTSVEVLAYYSVAFTFANMATMFTGAMTQSLVPAFSQLLTSRATERLNDLFTRSIRVNMFALLPLMAISWVAAKPFFTIWAGEDFGRESTFPFYVLTIALLLNLNAYIAGSVILAAGRSDILAKLFWIELVPYVAAAVALTSLFGAVGAALTWSLHAAYTAVFFNIAAKRIAGIAFPLRENFYKFIIGFSVLLPPVAAVFVTNAFSLWPAAILVVSLTVYAVLAWKVLIESEERLWVSEKFRYMFGLT